MQLAREHQTDIISADSRQCYKELSIGVARPTSEELEAVPHYFIATHSILEPVTAADFAAYALRVSESLFKTHDTIVMAGGTGLYVRAFTQGLDEVPPTDPALRAAIVTEYQEKGLAWLQEELRRLDPAFAASADMQNPQRMMRAMEVLKATGRSIRSFQSGATVTRPFEVEKTGLELPRETLYARINHRVDGMMEAGLLQEVEGLIRDFELAPGKPLPNALQTVGYTELLDYCFGRCSLEEAVERIKTNTRHYAKRQMTWFRRDPEIRWIQPVS